MGTEDLETTGGDGEVGCGVKPRAKEHKKRLAPYDEAPLEDLGRFLGNMLRVTGGSLLFALSALSILFGLYRIIGPVMSQSGALDETLPCLGALHGYELALLGVLLAIVLLRGILRDGVTLAVLIGVFLMANGIALATIANDAPRVAFGLGLASVVLAGAKLALLRRPVGMPLPGLLLAGAFLLVLWSFLVPPVLADLLRDVLPGSPAMRSAWQAGWWVMLAGVACFYAQALRKREDSPSAGVFLRRIEMAWVFVGVLVVTGALHQYALTYIFDVPVSWYDFAPLVSLLCLVVLEHVHAKRGEELWPFAVFGGVPLAMALCGRAFGHVLDPPAFGFSLLWEPAVLLLAVAIVLTWRAARFNGWLALSVALAYVTGIGLTLPQSISVAGSGINHEAGGVLLLLVLLALAVIHKSPLAATAAVFVFAVALPQQALVRDWVVGAGVRPEAATLFAAGFGMYWVCFIFRSGLPWWVAVLSALLCAWGIVLVFGALGSDALWGGGLLGFAMAAAFLWRTHDLLSSGLLCLPLALAVAWSPERLSGWHFIGLSFLLLGLGGGLSLRRAGGGAGPSGATNGGITTGHQG